MSKKTLIGIIIVLLLGGPFFAIKYIEGETEKQVALILTQQGISAKHVKYNLLDDVLRIQNLSLKLAFLPDSIILVDEIVALEPNPDAMDLETLGRPLIAKQIVINNIRGTYKFKAKLHNFHIESLSIDNWAQNLAKVAELAAKGYDEAFFTAVFDTSIDKIKYTGFSETGQLDLGSIPFSSKGKIASISLEKINSTKIGSYIIQDLDYTYDNNQNIKIISHLREFLWERINLPNPNFWALVMEVLPNLLNNSLSEDQKMKLLSHVKTGMNLFANTKFDMKDARVTLHNGATRNNLLDLEGASIETDFDLENYSKAKIIATLTGAGVDIKNLDLNISDEVIFAELLGEVLEVDAGLCNAPH